MDARGAVLLECGGVRARQCGPEEESMSKKILGGALGAALLIVSGAVSTGDAQRGPRTRMVRPFVRATNLGGGVTVDIRVQPMDAPNEQRTVTPTALPDTDWTCLASEHPNGGLGLTCNTRDMHTVSFARTQCERFDFVLGAGRLGSPTYRIVVGCE